MGPVVLAFIALLGAGQDARPSLPASDVPQATIRGTAQEVLLDIVVRDKKGHVVKDLIAKDFEVADDDAPQTIRSFRFVDGTKSAAPLAAAAAHAVAGPPATPEANAMDALRQIRIITLAFGRMGNDARNNARLAVNELLKRETGPNLFFAVFSIDQRLSILQAYTTDKERVRKAVEKATSSAGSFYKSESDQVVEELKTVTQQRLIYGKVNPLAPFAPPDENALPALPSGAPPDSSPAKELAKLALNIMEFSQLMDRTLQGRADLFALEALIGQQYLLPGRKSLLYFCEGIVIPPEYTDEFQALIGKANRVNVSVYGIDSRSLDSNAQSALGNALLTQAMKASRQAGNDGPLTRDQIIGVDRATEAIQANSQNSLADLSNKIGGFLIANTDARNQLHRVTEDIDAHYELAYGPEIRNFDGRFRKITVRVRGSDVQVQSRSGYFAVPATQGQMLMAYELPMLAALATASPPRDIPFRSALLHFQSPEGEPQGVIVLDVPMDGFRFDSDEKAKSYQFHFSVLAVIKDAQGAVVRKTSQDIPRSGPLDRLDGAKLGHFILSQPTLLSPGQYTLGTAVTDRQTGKVSAAMATFEIPAAAGTASLAAPASVVALSSIVLVRSVTQIDPEQAAAAAADPFQASSRKILPSLDDVVKVAPESKLTFYFTAYAPAGDKTVPELSIEFYRDGNLIADMEPTLPPPDARGFIPFLGAIPLETFKPGIYEMVATVRNHGKSASERAAFTVK